MEIGKVIEIGDRKAPMPRLLSTARSNGPAASDANPTGRAVEVRDGSIGATVNLREAVSEGSTADVTA
jgi:hypothetical protein